MMLTTLTDLKRPIGPPEEERKAKKAKKAPMPAAAMPLMMPLFGLVPHHLMGNMQ